MTTTQKKRWSPKSEDRQTAMYRLADEGRRDEFIARLRAEVPNGAGRSETGLLRCDDRLFYKLMKEFPPLPEAPPYCAGQILVGRESWGEPQ